MDKFDLVSVITKIIDPVDRYKLCRKECELMSKILFSFLEGIYDFEFNMNLRMSKNLFTGNINKMQIQINKNSDGNQILNLAYTKIHKYYMLSFNQCSS